MADTAAAAPAPRPTNRNWPALRAQAFDLLWQERVAPRQLRRIEQRIRFHMPQVEQTPGQIFLHGLLKRIGRDQPPLTTREQVIARLLLSMLEWRRTGSFTAPFRNVTEARLQFWESEWFCPVTGYQRAFLEAAKTRFPAIHAFEGFFSIFDGMMDDPPRLREQREADMQVVLTPGATQTLVAFSGLSHNCLGVGWSTFYRAVAAQVPANLVILKDRNRLLFLNGVEGMGGVAATRKTLAALADDPRFAGTEIVLLGASGGTFAALGATGYIPARRVVCLSGPTSLALGLDNEDKHVYQRINKMIEAGELSAPDPIGILKQSGIERVDFFVSAYHAFDFAQMRNLLDRTDGIVIPHAYPTALHSMIEYAVADGRLLAALRGEPLAPQWIEPVAAETGAQPEAG